jgi:nanoRNase/pAp phosphatase (c-di-AMP/oligoRNAs hydrolase)
MVDQRLKGLQRAVGGAQVVLILPHNDPDPDAIASVLGLQNLLSQTMGVTSLLRYRGIIGRAENRELVRYLGKPLRRLCSSDLAQGIPIALIDTQPGAGNNALPPGLKPAVVVDHHHTLEPAPDASFVDLCPEAGACSTILTGYLRAAGLEPPPPLATALFYGIKTDTMGLSRGASEADVEAYFYLQRLVDLEALTKIERAQVPAEYFQSLVEALQSARKYDQVLVSYLGPMSYPDMAAEMADLMLRLESICWVLCLGLHGGCLFLSVRTRQHSGAARLIQEIVRGRGTAGGHGAMAGGQVPLGDEKPERLAHELEMLALHHLGVDPSEGGDLIIACLS